MTAPEKERTAERPPMVIPEFSFADRLRKIRRDVLQNMSQEDLAEKIGVTTSTLSAYESGRSAPRGRDLPQVARRLEQISGVPATWTLGLLEPSIPNSENDSSLTKPLSIIDLRTLAELDKQFQPPIPAPRPKRPSFSDQTTGPGRDRKNGRRPEPARP